MAKPYQNLQGQWFVGNRPMSAQEIDLHQQVTMPFLQRQQTQQTQQGLGTPGVPTHPRGQTDPMAEYIVQEQARRDMMQNPIGAGSRSGIDYLRSLLGY